MARAISNGVVLAETDRPVLLEAPGVWIVRAGRIELSGRLGAPPGRGPVAVPR